MTDSGRPRVDYWHLYTDDQGVSRQRRCAFTDFERIFDQRARKPAVDRTPHPSSGLDAGDRAARRLDRRVAREPSSAVDHSAFRPLVRRVDGRPAHRDGTRRALLRGRSGHPRAERPQGPLSGTVGDQPAVLWLIQLDQAPAPRLPCPFRDCDYPTALAATPRGTPGAAPARTGARLLGA